MVKRDVSHKFVVDSFQFKLPKPFQGLYPHFKWSFDPWYSMFTPSLLGRGGDLSHTIVPLVHSTWSFTPYKFVADKYQKCRSRLIWGNFWDFYVGWMRGMVICEISLSLSLSERLLTLANLNKERELSYTSVPLIHPTWTPINLL